jgi:GlpG protein
MRLIGCLDDESNARTFGDYLYAQGIDNQIEFEKGAGWGLWIRDEDKLGRAAALLLAFRQHPTDPQYQHQARTAAGLRAGEAKAEAAYQKRLRERRHLFRPLLEQRFGLVTYGLIAISVLVFLVSNLGYDSRPIMGLFITSYTTEPSQIIYAPGLAEVRHGQVWRLLTPIFIHFGAMHILFNMLWLRDLGTMIETRQSSWHLGLLVVALGVCSNLAQYWMSGPAFGGMSGVVYGLLGYVWIRGKLDPASGLYLHPSTVWMMIIWFVLCFTSLFGHVANSAHAVGLGLGMAWGWLSGLRAGHFGR